MEEILESLPLEDEIIAGLKHAGGYLRSELARRMQLRYTPRLRFFWDPSPEHADRIDQLIASLHQEEQNRLADENEDDQDG